MSQARPACRCLLLISNSTLHGSGYLDHAEAEIRDFLAGTPPVLLVPYALFDRSISPARGSGDPRERADPACSA